jgi:hypothetical protein
VLSAEKEAELLQKYLQQNFLQGRSNAEHGGGFTMEEKRLLRREGFSKEAIHAEELTIP